MRRKIAIILLFISIYGKCQDTTKLKFVSVDIFKSISREVLLGFQMDLSDHFTADIQLGYMYPNQIFRNTFKELTFQERKPLYLSQGPTMRLGLFWHKKTSENKSDRFYVGPQFVYMYTNYNNKEFFDHTSSGEDKYFTRSEDTKVIGGEILMGQIVSIDKSSRTNLNVFWGAGIRNNLRNYKTLKTNDPYYAPLGEYNRMIAYITLVMGCRLLIKI